MTSAYPPSDVTPEMPWFKQLTKSPPPAWFATEAGPTEGADCDSLADAPIHHAFAERVDFTDDLVPRHPRILKIRKAALDGERIRVANPTRVDADPDFPGGRTVSARSTISSLPGS